MRTSWVVCFVFNAALLKLILFLQEPVFFFASFTLTLQFVFESQIGKGLLQEFSTSCGNKESNYNKYVFYIVLLY